MIEGYHGDNGDFIGLAERFKILFITSRKVKVMETATHKEFFLSDLRDVGAVICNKACSYSVVGTNAHVHSYIQQHYRKDNESTYFWRHFDFVVVDEFHSISTDAPFATCAITISHLIETILEDYNSGKCKTKIIMMSATPEPCEWLAKKTHATVFDFRNKIQSLKPTSIHILTYASAENMLIDYVRKYKTTVYYLSHFDKLFLLLKRAIDSGVQESEIAVSISDASVKKTIQDKYPLIYSNMQHFERAVSEENEIPPQFKLIVTNGRCKEAININTTIDALFIESHYSVDIEQICGRFRNGIRDTAVISDARQFQLHDRFSNESDYYRKKLKYDNKELLKRITPTDIPYPSILDNAQAMQFIDTMLEQTKYRAFNLLTEKFVINTPYIEYKKHYERSIGIINYVMRAKLAFTSLGTYFNSIPIRYPRYLKPYHYVLRWYEENKLMINESILSYEQFCALIEYLKESIHLLKDAPKKEYKQGKYILAAYNATFELVGRKTNKEQCKYRIKLSVTPALDDACALPHSSKIAV